MTLALADRAVRIEIFYWSSTVSSFLSSTREPALDWYQT